MFILLSIFGDWMQHLLYDIISKGNAGNYIANSHTIFKIVQVAILLPFSSLLVKATYLVVPGDDKGEVHYGDSFQLQFIGSKIFNPATAVVAAQNEIERMASLASDNLNRSMNALITMDQDTISEVFEVEKNIDFLSHEITNYLEDLHDWDTLHTVMDHVNRFSGTVYRVYNECNRFTLYTMLTEGMIGKNKERFDSAALMTLSDLFKHTKDIRKLIESLHDDKDIEKIHVIVFVQKRRL
jgi:Na+/phosphate symporter